MLNAISNSLTCRVEAVVVAEPRTKGSFELKLQLLQFLRLVRDVDCLFLRHDLRKHRGSPFHSRNLRKRELRIARTQDTMLRAVTTKGPSN